MAISPINDQEKHDKVDEIVASLEGVDIYSDDALTAYQQIIEQYDTLEYEHIPEVIILEHKSFLIDRGDPTQRHQLIDCTREIAAWLWIFAHGDRHIGESYPAVLGTPVYR